MLSGNYQTVLVIYMPVCGLMTIIYSQKKLDIITALNVSTPNKNITLAKLIRG